MSADAAYQLLDATRSLVSLTKPTDKEGVGDGMDAKLFGGGFKHFDIEKFIEVVEAQAWKKRANVQLWIKGAEAGVGEEQFIAVKLRRRQVTPTSASIT